PRWEAPLRVVVIVQGETELLEVVAALSSCGGLTDLLNRRQQQAHQHCQNCKHHKEFDQSERTVSLPILNPHSTSRFVRLRFSRNKKVVGIARGVSTGPKEMRRNSACENRAPAGTPVALPSPGGLT